MVEGTTLDDVSGTRDVTGCGVGTMTGTVLKATLSVLG